MISLNCICIKKTCPYCMSDHGHGHGQETEAAPQSLHLNHLLFFFSFFLFFYFFFTFCNVLTHQGTALLQSLPQRNLLSSARPEANTAHKSHPCIQTSASDPPPGTQHRVRPPNTGPGATSRGNWKELWAVLFLLESEQP